MKKIIYLIVLLALFLVGLLVIFLNVNSKNIKCHSFTRQYYQKFVDERTQLQLSLTQLMSDFNSNTLTNFIKNINDGKYNSKHTYPFLLDESDGLSYSNVIAHGLKPISYFKDIDCLKHERYQAWDILMSSIYAAKEFPILVFYHIDERLRETLVQKVEKDNKAYYLGIGFYLK